MTLNWYPKGKWPSKCAGCAKKIPSSSRRAHDPATNQGSVPTSEHTKAGLERVRANGIRLGRPPLHEIDSQRVRNLRSEGKSWSAVLKEMGLPKTALSAAQRFGQGRRGHA